MNAKDIIQFVSSIRKDIVIPEHKEIDRNTIGFIALLMDEWQKGSSIDELSELLHTTWYNLSVYHLNELPGEYLKRKAQFVEFDGLRKQ